MINELHDLWERTLVELQKHMLKPSAETWLKSAKPLALYEDTVVVGLPNDFVKSWVESRYAAPIKTVLQELTRRDMSLKFVVPPDSSPGESQDLPFVQPMRDDTQSKPSNGSSKDMYSSRLNAKYTFDSFVIGQSNRFAHAAALAVSAAPAETFNPLFIYGGVGLGKTHLMHAIGHSVTDNDPASRVRYVSTETFTNDMIASISDRRMADFRARYRNADVLLLDDVQFVAGKEGIQEELFHTFDALHQASKQIVLSSDRPPREIATLEERLRTRFEWGLVSDIQPPDLETRMAILSKKAQDDGLSIPTEVTSYIAQQITSNIRELEGALVRISAYASLVRRPIDFALAKEALRDLFPDSRQDRPITADLIQNTVADYYSLDPVLLRERKRTRAVAFPRQIAMYLCRELTDYSLPKIGEEFGGRDHTTVLHACDKIGKEIAKDTMLAGTLRQLETRIRGK